MIFLPNDYTLLDIDKQLVTPCIWDISSAGGNLYQNRPFEDSEILLESDLMEAGVNEKDLALHMVVYDVSKGESFVFCGDLTAEQQLILEIEYDLKEI